MLSFLVLVALTQSSTADKRGPVAVLISSKRTGAEAFAPKLAERVQAALTREGLSGVVDDEHAVLQLKAAGFSDPKSCQGGKSCLTKLAVLMGAKAVVVGVDVGKIANQLAVHLEAVGAEGGEPLAVADFSAPTENFGDQAAVEIAVFARALTAKVNPAPVADAPVLANLEPPPPPPPLVGNEAPAPHSKVLPLVLGGGAVAAFAATAVFGILGAQDKSAYDASRFDAGGVPASHLSKSQLDALASSGNTRFTLALTTAIVGVGLAAASTYFFVRE